MRPKIMNRFTKWLKDRMPGVWENFLASIILAILGSLIGLLVIFKNVINEEIFPFFLRSFSNVKIDAIVFVLIILAILVSCLFILLNRAALNAFLKENQADDFQLFKLEIKRAASIQGLSITEESSEGSCLLAKSKNNELISIFIEPNSSTIITRRRVGYLLKIMTRFNSRSGKYISRNIRDFFSNRTILAATKDQLQFVDYTNYALSGIDFSKHLEDLISDWQKNETSRVYINTMGKDEHDHLHAILDESMDMFISNTDNTNKNIIILGDFGSGKTTFLRYYSYLLAKRYLRSPFANLIPVFISLREFEIEGSIARLISKILEIPTEKLDSAINLLRDKWVLILDGFDEMSLLVDRASVQRNIQRLEDIATQKNGALIVSCRTHFFRDSVEEDQLMNFWAIHLEPWNDEFIETFLKKSLGGNWEQARTLIYNTYNLHELAQTPLFLDMTVDSLDGIHGKKIRALA